MIYTATTPHDSNTVNHSTVESQHREPTTTPPLARQALRQAVQAKVEELHKKVSANALSYEEQLDTLERIAKLNQWLEQGLTP